MLGELATLFTNALCTIRTLRSRPARRLRRDGLRMVWSQLVP
jgi:hypothetical protein